MAKIHTLTYNGTKSSDLGVFVTGSGSFDAAEFDVDKYEIPGRNGDLILSNNRYKNIEITYPAFIPKAFMDKAQNVRNWLRSSKVYARLEDTYDMDHYRLGIPTGVQSFSPENRNDGANFDMTFDCKPQRFLKVGETPETVEADVQTESGEIVTFETVAESPITSASVSLSPIQSLNGYDSPWPGGGGKNKLPSPTATSKTSNGITISVSDGVYRISGTATATAEIIFDLPFDVTAPSSCSCAFFNDAVNDGVLVYWRYNYTNGASIGFGGSTNKTANYAKTFTLNKVRFLISRGTVISGTLTTSPVIYLTAEATPTSFVPYENLCPISGHAGAELNIAAEYDAEDKTTYSVTFTDQGTVYGGTYDFVSGKLRVTHRGIDLSTLSGWSKYANIDGTVQVNISGLGMTVPGYDGVSSSDSLICSHLKNASRRVVETKTDTGIGIGNASIICIYAGEHSATVSDWTTYLSAQTAAGTPVMIVAKLATPLEYTLSPQQLTTLLGQNVMWGSGPITLTYAEPYNIDNPTLFDARPLFTVTNPAEGDVIMVNGQAITFVDGYAGTVFIDCETMNAYSGAANLNSIIQATDFPVLVPGTNIVTWTGAGECTMTPRWWEL